MAVVQHVSNNEILVRALSATILGTFIGAERQWRSRNAGLRTNALVAAGAALFVMLSAQGFVGDVGTPDPTRVAAQIVSGIGFLGAGVIMRDGFNVRGLNTAATLWCSAAVGALCGAGLLYIALVGTVIVLMVNTIMRRLSRVLLSFPSSGEEHPVDYIVRARSKKIESETSDGENKKQVKGGKFRETVLKAVKGSNLPIRTVESYVEDDCHCLNVVLSADNREDAHIETMITKLSMNPLISVLSWEVVSPDSSNEHKHGGSLFGLFKK